MHLHLTYMPERTFPQLAEPLAVRSAHIWQCKYRSLAPLAALMNLETLEVMVYPDDSFEPLAHLSRLRYLRLLHFPHATDLGPLSHCAELESVTLESLPSWDSSGKVLTVDSLEPLARLPRLRHLQLFGVRPPDRSLKPLLQLRSLVSVRVSKYPKRETASFYETSGLSNAHCPEPVFDSA